MTFDLIAHLRRHIEWSTRTFGPGKRDKALVAHISKELAEICADPLDITEWIDVAILALDGAWRTGATPEQIAEAWQEKQARNEARSWPDWRKVPDGTPIEHIRDEP